MFLGEEASVPLIVLTGQFKQRVEFLACNCLHVVGGRCLRASGVVFFIRNPCGSDQLAKRCVGGGGGWVRGSIAKISTPHPVAFLADTSTRLKQTSSCPFYSF